MTVMEELAKTIGRTAACGALGLSRSSAYRRSSKKEPTLPREPRPTPPRALTPDERRAVVDVMNSERFADKAPATIHATLLDEGKYLCCARTMYRILHANGPVRERRDQLRHPSYAKPELLADRPNAVWSWDITKLRGPVKSSHFSLYVIIDVFSRYVVGWTVAPGESAAIAETLIAETCAKEKIQRDQLTIHADRGSAMKSKAVTYLLADLGITKTHSRPHVSDDNPYSEAQFKTLKYMPGFPDRFGSLEGARAFCVGFFAWYNLRHRHSGIAMLTPANVHSGAAEEVLKNRQVVLNAAYRAHPERFGRMPVVRKPAAEVWINKPVPAAAAPSVEGLGAGSGAGARGPGTDIARSAGAASAVPGPSTPALPPQEAGAH